MQRYGNLLSIRDWLRYAVSRFNRADLSYGHGTDNAYDEAAYLILHTLHLPPDTLDPFLDARLLDHERTAVRDVIERRITSRLPAPYITGEAWLRGRRFEVDVNVLVPRSPIAELLDEGLSPFVADPTQVGHVMDMCTGSGCLAILAAQAFPQAEVHGVDLSEAALKVARRNVAAYGLDARVHLHQSDLFTAVPKIEFDLIICNPPYVNAQSMSDLPPEYRHEPHMALAGGADGMDLVHRILAGAPTFLTPQGMLLLEIGHEREHFEAAFPDLEPIWLDSAEAHGQLMLLYKDQLAGRQT
nr:50S ribosomal protein L3 N(5)-glutamine methyltransferase [Pseudomonas sp.]